jgi:hypothetical protein
VNSIDRVTERFGVRDGKLEVLPDRLLVSRVELRCVQEACDAGYIIVREQMGRVLVQESSGDENFELLVPIELQDAADAVQDLTTHATATGFETTERAAVDFGQLSHLFLSHAAIVPEPRQYASQLWAWSRGQATISTRHSSEPIRQQTSRHDRTSRANWRGSGSSLP